MELNELANINSRLDVHLQKLKLASSSTPSMAMASASSSAQPSPRHPPPLAWQWQISSGWGGPCHPPPCACGSLSPSAPRSSCGGGHGRGGTARRAERAGERRLGSLVGEEARVGRGCSQRNQIGQGKGGSPLAGEEARKGWRSLLCRRGKGKRRDGQLVGEADRER